MTGECHAHLFMDGYDYKKSVERHKVQVDKEAVRKALAEYQKQGVNYVRDGGDHFGVSVYARSIAPEYGITYRTPVFAISREGHYGRIVGKSADTLRDYGRLVHEVKRQHGDFIKIMVSGIMEYSEFGILSEKALDKDWIFEMIHIAHEEGMAVMVHGNGKEAVLPAVEAGADSIEHGNYLDRECLYAMKENNCVWVPTIVTTGNLIGVGRYDDQVLKKIYEMECCNLIEGFRLGVTIAAGSDAGAYKVHHGTGIHQELDIFHKTLRAEGYTLQQIDAANEYAQMLIRKRFKTE